MTLEEIIILIARIIGSLLVFKWNFFGAIIAILVDFSDLFMMNLLHLGGVRNYQMFDKIIDLFYLIFFLIVTFKWTKKLRNISIFLFVLRIIGFVLFEIFHNRLILFIFPNVFELWFLAIAYMKLFKYEITTRKLVVIFTIVLILKLIHEYILHVWKVLDNYRAVDVLNNLLRFLNILD